MKKIIITNLHNFKLQRSKKEKIIEAYFFDCLKILKILLKFFYKYSIEMFEEISFKIKITRKIFNKNRKITYFRIYYKK